MNLRDLNYLIVLSEEKHFGRAAERCFVSQPTLSMQIKKLEEFLNVKLVERLNRQLVVTDVGAEIIARAREVVAGADDIRNIAKLAQNPFSGELRLGVIPTIAPYLLPSAMHVWSEEFPELQVVLREGQTHVITEELKNGKLDAIILAILPDMDAADIEPMYDEPFWVAVSADHAFASKTEIRQKDLKKETLLLLEDGHCLREQALEACHFSSMGEGGAFRASSLETVRQMVASGAGVTIMPERAKRDGDGIVYVPFAAPVPARTIGMQWRESSPRKELLQKMCGLLR